MDSAKLSKRLLYHLGNITPYKFIYILRLPIIADADTGFGEGEMCAKTVWEYFTAGASGK